MNFTKIVIFSLIFSYTVEGKTPIAVLDFEANGISSSENRALIHRLRNELFKLGAYQVIEREMIEEVLQEQGFQQSGCTTNECLVTIGRLIGVKQIAGGSISVVGNIYTVSARIIDVETGEVIKVTDYDMKGNVDKLLTSGMQQVAIQLSGDTVKVNLTSNGLKPGKKIFLGLHMPNFSLFSIRLPSLNLTTKNQLWEIQYGFTPPAPGYIGHISYKIANSFKLWYLLEFDPFIRIGLYSYYSNEYYDYDVVLQRGYFTVLGGRKQWSTEFATLSASLGLGINWYHGYEYDDWDEYYYNRITNSDFLLMGNMGITIERFFIPILLETNFMYMSYSERLIPFATIGLRF